MGFGSLRKPSKMCWNTNSTEASMGDTVYQFSLISVNMKCNIPALFLTFANCVTNVYLLWILKNVFIYIYLCDVIVILDHFYCAILTLSLTIKFYLFVESKTGIRFLVIHICHVIFRTCSYILLFFRLFLFRSTCSVERYYMLQQNSASIQKPTHI